MDQTVITTTGSKKACVIGGTGYLASILIKHLLQSGYKVNTTVRDPGSSPSPLILLLYNALWMFYWLFCSEIAENEKKMAHLRQLQELGDLKIFKADLTDEESFDVSFLGCEYIFHVATPINFTSEDPEVCL